MPLQPLRPAIPKVQILPSEQVLLELSQFIQDCAPLLSFGVQHQRCSPFPRTRGRVSVGAGIDLVSISVCRMTPRDQTAFPDNSGRRHPAGGEVAHPERNRQVTNRLPRLTQRYGRSHAARTAASKLHHAGACCGLVDKRQSGRIKHAPLSHPTPTHLSQFDALLLRRL